MRKEKRSADLKVERKAASSAGVKVVRTDVSTVERSVAYSAEKMAASMVVSKADQ